VAKAASAQVAHGLPILDAAELRLVENGLFEFGICDLAFGVRRNRGNYREESDH
jgi:hypothetical protein